MQAKPVRCPSCGRQILEYYEPFNRLVRKTGSEDKNINSKYDIRLEDLSINPETDIIINFFKKNNLKICCTKFLIGNTELERQISKLINFADEN